MINSAASGRGVRPARPRPTGPVSPTKDALKQKGRPGGRTCLAPYASQQFTMPADPRGAERRLKGPTDADRGGDVVRFADGGDVGGDIQEGVGAELMVDVEAEADAIRAGGGTR